MKRLKEEQGFTLMELIVSLAVIAIFYLILSTLLASGSKIYLQQTVMGNAEALIDGIADEIKGYVIYGEDIQVYYRITPGDTFVAGTNLDAILMGTVKEAQVYPVADAPGAGDNAVCVMPDGTKTYVKLDDVKNFYGNAVDLGYKKIYLKSDGDQQYIQGLSYSKMYYRGLDMTLRIVDEEEQDAILNPAPIPDPNKKGLYTIEVTGADDRNTYMFESSVAVGGLNEK